MSPREVEPSDGPLGVGIVVARYHTLVADRLLEGALSLLSEEGVAGERILVARVPGAFEVPPVARALADRPDVDAVVALGCVVEGETDHYRHVCEGCARGIARVALETGVPVGFGVLMVRRLEDALARSGGEAGNKGREAAAAAVRTARLLRALREV